LTNNNFQKLQKHPRANINNASLKLYNTVTESCTKTKSKTLFRKIQPPFLEVQIKIHKLDQPFRPVVNNMSAPAYKVSKFMANKLNNYLNLKCHYNVKDSITLASDLTKLKRGKNYKMINFDIKDLYVNIPIKETLSITKALLLEHNNEQTTKQIISLLDIILRRNYFTSQNNAYQPVKGISMGSSISGIVAEIFLQQLENSQFNQILEIKNTVFYTRYVDDMLIIYNTERISFETIHNYMNKIHHNLEFTPTHEHNNSISFLDLLTIRQPSKIETDIYRKPTTTDITINFTSNHPAEHKVAAYRYLINRMLSLSLSLSLSLTHTRTHTHTTEWQKILTIASNNRFPLPLIDNLK
jgi:hypothetical protein